MMPDERNEDRRVQRTKRSLHHAMASLVHEKSFDAIAVKEIIARADVGRSAFYAHFRSKDDLFASAIRETLSTNCVVDRTADYAERTLRFSRPLFEHIAHFGVSRMRAQARRAHLALHDRVRVVLIEHLTGELRSIERGRAWRESATLAIPVDLLAAHLADSFLGVVAWWSVQPVQPPVDEIEALFRQLVLPAVNNAFARR